MAYWHSDLHKRKKTGGKSHSYRGRRKYERGRYPVETQMGDRVIKVERTRGGNIKIRVIRDNAVNLSVPSSGKTVKCKILRVVKNPSNKDYDRRGVITKGTIIETEHGLARVTSKLSSDGVVNAVLIESKT
ncbi:MAG: 30S ribosomal protein S8e [Candidatus Bathyarchaeia archaeon]